MKLFLTFLSVFTFQIASNNLFLGIDYRISGHNTKNSFNVGIGSYVIKFENKKTNSETLELHIYYTYRNLYLYELSITNKGLNPNIGFNLLNF